MNRSDALPFIGYAVDTALSERLIRDVPHNARLVGWQCGFEPVFVAVWSYLPNCSVDDDEAVEVATDLLIEKCWFKNVRSTPPDYIL